jgi:hypothetical protein
MHSMQQPSRGHNLCYFSMPAWLLNALHLSTHAPRCAPLQPCPAWCSWGSSSVP